MTYGPEAIHAAIPLPREALGEFCRKWGVIEFALFGSVLRDDFSPESDVDVLVELDSSRRYGLWELTAMEGELAAIWGRKVDLLEKGAVERSRNPYRRRDILKSARVIDVAA